MWLEELAKVVVGGGMGPGDKPVRRDHHKFSERWGEELNFREWRSELGTEEGVPRFLV